VRIFSCLVTTVLLYLLAGFSTCLFISNSTCINCHFLLFKWQEKLCVYISLTKLHTHTVMPTVWHAVPRHQEATTGRQWHSHPVYVHSKCLLLFCVLSCF
jgi:hypothetical protein